MYIYCSVLFSFVSTMKQHVNKDLNFSLTFRRTQTLFHFKVMNNFRLKIKNILRIMRPSKQIRYSYKKRVPFYFIKFRFPFHRGICCCSSQSKNYGVSRIPTTFAIETVRSHHRNTSASSTDPSYSRNME